jgi:hypothetical protein
VLITGRDESSARVAAAETGAAGYVIADVARQACARRRGSRKQNVRDSV